MFILFYSLDLLVTSGVSRRFRVLHPAHRVSVILQKWSKLWLFVVFHVLVRFYWCSNGALIMFTASTYNRNSLCILFLFSSPHFWHGIFYCHKIQSGFEIGLRWIIETHSHIVYNVSTCAPSDFKYSLFLNYIQYLYTVVTTGSYCSYVNSYLVFGKCARLNAMYM